MTEIQDRKSSHLRIVLEEDVQHPGTTLLEHVHLLNESLPELSLGEIDTSCTFFGKRLEAPLMITGMTGGAGSSGELNRALAQAAAKQGIAFSVGSQRVMLDHPETRGDFAVREFIPEGVLLANLGAVQARDHPPAAISGLVEAIDADGLCLHLNPAQELAQRDGDRDFRGLLDVIARLVDHLEGRVLVKEVGAGFSPRTLTMLCGAGVRYVDVAGAGGTSWTKVEGLRELEKAGRTGAAPPLGEVFADWGLPTAVCVIAARRLCPTESCIVGSGGITTGLEAAKAIACGADMAGVARAALLAYAREGVEDYLDAVVTQLKAAMLLTASPDLASLRQAGRVYTGTLRDWLAAFHWLDEETR
jgi:isopentenyl-diphosphate delta-isomerase